MPSLEMKVEDFEKLQTAMKNFQGNAVKIINNVFHNDGVQLVGDEIQRLMPASGRTWNGKASPAKTSKSLTSVKEDLAFTIKATNKYQYLYYPDDGSSTRHHAGNLQFFARGGETKQNEIIERCIARLAEEI